MGGATQSHVRDIGFGFAAVLAGLLTISVGTEALEFGLVVIWGGEVVTEPEAYFAVRNQLPFLLLKVLYNTAFALAGGYVARWVARGYGAGVVLVLAVLQTFFLVWGAFGLEMGAYTPLWMWAILILLTGPAVVMGGIVRARRDGASPEKGGT